ncbi:MAG TPA: hypothetical protein VD736_10345 [Nitrososphaera sp.]|nr:hypothetical protein [Nitrososphaera sp.]
MKRGHYVIIGGAALFALGISVIVAWALPIAEQIRKETAFLQGEQLNPGESESLLLEVTDTSKPLSVFVSSTDAAVPLAIGVSSPEGEVLLDRNFTENTIMSTEPTVTGSYVLNVTNEGQSATSIDAIFGRFPAVEENNQVEFETFGGVLAGAGIVIAGIIVMIAGVAIVIVDRRRRALSR